MFKAQVVASFVSAARGKIGGLGGSPDPAGQVLTPKHSVIKPLASLSQARIDSACNLVRYLDGVQDRQDPEDNSQTAGKVRQAIRQNPFQRHRPRY